MKALRTGATGIAGALQFRRDEEDHWQSRWRIILESRCFSVIFNLPFNWILADTTATDKV